MKRGGENVQFDASDPSRKDDDGSSVPNQEESTTCPLIIRKIPLEVC